MATAAVTSTPAQPRQNWIVGPGWDMTYFIATPILALVAVALLYPLVGLAWLSFGFMIYTIAHHFPTFLRIYGDRDLFRRYRWNFILGPVFPFVFAMAAFWYIFASSTGSVVPIEKVLYLMFIPTLWDAWHFLMQHYGFVRIYDRPNPAPRRLASWMDLALCAAWFTAIMVKAGGWLPGLMDWLSRDMAIPALYLVDQSTYRLFENAMLASAAGITVIYLGYLVWCKTRGLFISRAKLLLLLITFGIMYLTYVPNPVMDGLVVWWNAMLGPAGSESSGAPLRWTFWLGFVVMGLVHNTQYFAIVWKYNRSLTRRPDPRRPALFQNAFMRGGAMVLAGYVLICLVYGAFLGAGKGLMAGVPWVWGTLFALVFTSTLMHYYFDGFIWKVRHRENQEHLAMLDSIRENSTLQQESQLPSWWDRWRGGLRRPVLRTACKHLAYFGVPMLVLSIGAWKAQRSPARRPLVEAASSIARIDLHAQRGKFAAAVGEADRAIALLDAPIAAQRRLLAISPMAGNYAALAELTHDQAPARAELAARRAALQSEEVRALRGPREIDRALRRFVAANVEALYVVQVQRAVAAMTQALSSPGPLDANPIKLDVGKERVDAYRALAEWNREIGANAEAARWGALAGDRELSAASQPQHSFDIR